MGKQRGLEAKLERVWRLRGTAATPEGTEVLRSALQDRSNFLVAEAAAIVAAQNLTELRDALADAFNRFMLDPPKADQGCRALIAITDALNRLEYMKPEIFLRGLQHVQMIWSTPPEDHAAPLRAHAAMGLARIEYPGVVNLLTELLLDKEPAARAGAAQALAGTGKLSVVPLLRYKVLEGDVDSAVLGNCFASLIALEPEESIRFVAKYLRSHSSEIQSEAALALGESRRAEALDFLKQCVTGNSSDPFQETLLLAIAMVRSPAAIDFLLDVVVAGRPDSAAHALKALAIHRHNSDVQRRALAAVTGKDKALGALYERKFRAASD